MSAQDVFRGLPAVSRTLHGSLGVDACRSSVSQGLLWPLRTKLSSKNINDIEALQAVPSRRGQLARFFLRRLREGWDLSGARKDYRRSPSCEQRACPSALVAADHSDMQHVGPVVWTARFVERGTAEKHARWLISWRADANEKDDLGWTPLAWAAQRSNAKLCKILLEGCADANSSGQLSALSIARRLSHHEVTDMLLTAGSTRTHEVRAHIRVGRRPHEFS